MPIGNSKEWLAYSGRIGDYWTKIKPPEGSTSTPSPTSPGSHADWRNFKDNYSGWGFDLGFFDGIFSSITWVSDIPNGD